MSHQCDTTVVQMTSYRSGQGDAFHIATDPFQIGPGVAVVHPQYVLLDNRPGVQFLGYVGDPEGARFTEPPAGVEETFYIIAGSIRCTPRDGQTIEWRAGDLVYRPYDEELELEYSPGLKCICFVWSNEALPVFTGGV